MGLGELEDVAKIRSDLEKEAGVWMKQHLNETMPLDIVSAMDENPSDQHEDAADTEKELGDDQLKTIYHDAENHKQRFLIAIETYAKETNSITELNLNDEHTWDEVLNLLDQTISIDEGNTGEGPKESNELENETMKACHNGPRRSLKDRMRKRDVKSDQRQEGKGGDQKIKGTSIRRNIQGVARRKYERFGASADTFKSWLGLLPTESHYLSTLCGGLKLIIGAAQRLSEIRSYIRDFVESIPKTLSGTARILNVFANSPELHRCSAAIYVAILKPLMEIYEWSHKRLLGRIAMAHVKQAPYAKKMTDMMENVKACWVQFREQADELSHERQLVMKKMIEKSSRMNGLGFNTLIQENRYIALKAEHTQNDRESNAETRFEITRRESKETSVEIFALLHEVKNLLTSNPRPYRMQDAQTVNPGQRVRTPKSSTTLASKHVGNGARHRNNTQTQTEILYNSLDIDHDRDVVAEDVSNLLRLAGTLSRASQDRSVSLMQSPRLQSWLTCTTSSVLHVNGHMFSSASGEQRQSPLSFVCAKLVDVLVPKTGRKLAKGTSTVLAVCWFCGQHTDCSQRKGSDYDAHPTGMMNNLISQLLIQLCSLDQIDYDLDLDLKNSTVLQSFIQSGNLNQEGGSHSTCIKTLCQIFTELVCLLPEGIILFCIVDGISYYEDEDRVEELHQIMSTLTDLANEIWAGRVFKLLTTSPLRLHEVSTSLYEDEIYDMNARLPPNGGFTTTKWDNSLGRGVKDVSRAER